MMTELEKLNEDIIRDPHNESLLIRRGRLHWALGHRSPAMKDWLAALAVNPQSPANELLRNAEEILAYRNNDLYNP